MLYSWSRGFQISGELRSCEGMYQMNLRVTLGLFDIDHLVVHQLNYTLEVRVAFTDAALLHLRGYCLSCKLCFSHQNHVPWGKFARRPPEAIIQVQMTLRDHLDSFFGRLISHPSNFILIT